MKKSDQGPRSTIIATPLRHAHGQGNLLSANAPIELLPDGRPGERFFKIKRADSFARRTSASRLIGGRYAWRGYRNAGLPGDQVPNRITLSALDEDETIGTITVGLDGPEGLNSDDSFQDANDRLRNDSRRLCEFTKFAIDPTIGTKRVLAALFHVAFIVAYRLNNCDVAVIEVNPRHVKYYERMLGFTIVEGPRINKTVDAPAVLLMLELSHARSQIELFGGKGDLADTTRSLYPFFYSVDEEIRIVVKLAEVQRSGRKVPAQA